MVGVQPANAAPYTPPLTSPGSSVNTDRVPQGSAPGLDAIRSIAEQARKAPDGNFYVPDPNNPGRWLRVDF
jgi:hypothetical protein